MLIVPPVVVTEILVNPASPVGVTAVIEVEDNTTILVAGLLPTVTLLAPVKLVPVILIAVPPEVDPEVGLTEVIVGAGTTYVKALAWVAVPPLVITTRSCMPVPAGVLAVIDVLDATTTLVAKALPIFTVAPETKFVPVIAIAVAPRVDPEDGVTPVIVGAGTTYVNAAELVAVPPGVVTATLLAPGVPLGVTAVIELSELTETLVAATPPIFTTVAPVKLVPLIVIVVPPNVDPVDGIIDVIIGNGVTKVNAFNLVPIPLGVVTTTLLAPGVPAGVTAVMEVADTTITLVAGSVPTITLVAPVKFVPLIVIAVPPRVDPEIGLIDEMVGGGATYVNAFAAVPVPLGVDTVMSFKPNCPAGVFAVMLVEVVTTTLVAAAPPTVTLVVPVKLVPVMAMAVPPLVDPESGFTFVIVGAAI